MPPEKAQLNAAIYDRVSADKRRDARSVTEQKTANITACNQHGWDVSEIFTDNDRSASRFARKSRPDWERLGEALEAGAFDVLVMWEPSRGGRELEIWARLLNVCQSGGVLIHITSHDRTYDVRRARDRRSLAEDGVDSEYESGKTSERIRRGTRARAAEGKPHGKRLYGYDRVYDGTGRLDRQVINEDEAAIIRDVADMVARGMSLTGIATRLNIEGIPSPRGAAWQSSPIKRLLLNPAYVGYRVHLGEKIHSPEWFPPILDDRTYYLCASKLTDPARGGERPSAIKHLLSGLAVCGVCGAKMRILKGTSGPAYSCKRTVPDGGPAFHASRSKARVEEYVESLVVIALQDPERLSAMTATEDSSELREILAELEEERARLDEFYVKAARGELSAAGLAVAEAGRLPKIEALERRARGVRFMPHVGDLLAGGPDDVPARWRALDITPKRDIIVGMFDLIEIMPVGSGRRNIPDRESVRVTPRSASNIGTDRKVTGS